MKETINIGDKVQLGWVFPKPHRVPIWGIFAGEQNFRYLLKPYITPWGVNEGASISKEFIMYKINDWSDVELS